MPGASVLDLLHQGQVPHAHFVKALFWLTNAYLMMQAAKTIIV